MSLRITVHQDYVANHEEVVLLAPEGGTVQFCSAEFVGGGTGRNLVLTYVTLHEVSEQDAQKLGEPDLHSEHLRRLPKDAS